MFLVIILSNPIVLFSQSVQINEFLASNVRDFPEMYDFGDYNDWIELHNTTDSDIMLDGFFLSDDPEEPLKWRFPDTAIIPTNEFLLVWADGHDDTPGSMYMRESWPYDDYIIRHYHTNFKLSKSGEAIILAQADITGSTTLVAAESTWKYMDDGSEQAPNWKDIGFNDLSWPEGQAELGYGDGDENTVVSYGDNSDQKYITTYFRKTFLVSDASSLDDLVLQLKRDDGAVVYLNGTEVVRTNLPSGEILHETEASSAVSSAEEDAFFSFSIDANDLVTGENCLAVEIHQISETSSDISFDLELTGYEFSPAVIIDQIFYGPQVTDVSYGVVPDGSTWAYFGEPTPGMTNATPTSPTTARSTTTQASLPSGFYDSPTSVTLSTDSPDATIHYTLDGSRPGSSSQVYSGAINILSTAVLKARAFEEDLLPGDILTHSYFIGEQQHLPTISLVAEPPTLWDTDIGIYENEYKQREIPVTIHLFDPNGQPGFSIDAGSRLGGLNIWTKPQKPFTIYTRDRFGADAISYHLFKSKPITDFSRIVFRNGGDDWEETLLRDPMTGSLVQGMMDCGYMGFQPSALFLNGDYWGIYNIREKYNKRYFFENFGVDPDNIDHLEYGATASGTRLLTIEGDLLAYNDLLTFIQTSDLDDPDRFEELSTRMNIDGFIDHVVMTLYCANTSWGHNREWWRPRQDDGKWQWLIVDVDRGFNPSNVNTNLLDNLLDGYYLFQYLMASHLFEERFLQRAAAHINNTFQASRIESIVDSLSNMIRDEMPRHIDRWGPQGGIASMTAWENELQAIKTFAQNRPGNLYTHFNNELDLDGTIQINTATYLAEGGHILINGVPQLSENETGTYFKNQPVELTAVPAPGYEVIGWNGITDDSTITYWCETDTSFIALFQPSTGILLPGELTENTTLLNDHTYYVAENLLISEGVTMEVEAGVEIMMPDQGHIVVEGQLIINGTEASPVSILPNLAAGVTTWGGLAFTNEIDTSKISHLNVRGGTKGTDPMVHRGTLSGTNANLLIDHLDIRDVLFPIFISCGSIELINSTLHCDFISDYINVKNGEAIIDNCLFYGNEAPDTDAIDLDGVTAGVVSNNHIYDFSGSNSDGIDLGEQSQGILITNNQIYHASDKGISVGQQSTTTIERNLIVGCKWGVAVKDSSTASLSNNTYANNEISLVCFEKNTGNGGGEAWERNSIFYNNLNSILWADEHSEISVTYSLSDMSVMPGIGNLTDDPLFINPLIYNFELEPLSPCIDSGDPSSPTDPDGTPIDIGAYINYDPDDYPFHIPGSDLHQLKLNEFLASNDTQHSDEAGEFDDWLELFNPTNSLLDLTGLYLTDSPENLTKWQFPAGASNIDPGGFLIIWCDEDGEQGLLHANFKLSASGEFIGLVDPNGLTIIDSLHFGPQETDISYGRVVDGGEIWGSMDPTPGSSNVSLDNLATNNLPEGFSLYQNYPNPFNPMTRIRYDVPVQTQVQLLIYDLRGRLVKTLVNQSQAAGHKAITWDGTNENGFPAAAGLYIYSLQTKEFAETKKLVLLK